MDFPYALSCCTALCGMEPERFPSPAKPNASTPITVMFVSRKIFKRLIILC